MEVITPKEYIQVGYTALRRPGTGEFLPATPLFIQAEDGAEEAQESLIRDIGTLFAQRMQSYKKGCRDAGIRYDA